MKEVIYGEELKKLKVKAINRICNTVKTTLGPTGNNVLVSNNETQPFITNDGVTIAKNIESDDMCENAILEIIKEASLKTNELVGDGTTTTLVLLQSIFNQGIEAIENGIKGIKLKEELEIALRNVTEILSFHKKMPTKKQLESVASISSNSKEIGKLISDLYQKVNNNYSIKLKESPKEETYYIMKKGYIFEISKISSVYFQKQDELELSKPKVIILKGYLSSLEQISDIINETYKEKSNLVIIVEDISDIVKEEILSLYLSESLGIIALTIDEYASHRDNIENDIATISGANIKNIDYEKVEVKDIGKLDNVIIDRDTATIISDNNKNKDLINKLHQKLELTYEKYEQDFIKERLSKLEKGIINLYVGGITKTEKREKLMRYEDAIESIESAREGIIIGGGITLLQVADRLNNDTVASKILKEALSSPFNTIVENTGNDASKIKAKIVNSNYQTLYNFEKKEYESVKECLVYDSIKVVETAIKNAVSIAAILLTTSHMVINEKYDKNLEI